MTSRRIILNEFGGKGEAMKEAPTIITGTVGMDAHVIGTKVISRALKDAGFNLERVEKEEVNGPKRFRIKGIDPMRCGAILGQSESNTDILLANHIAFLHHNGPKRMNPFTLPQSNCNVGATTAAEWFYLRGTCFTVATACSSATHAIGMAALNIKTGIEDIVVTGGADAPLEPYFFSGFDVIKALSLKNDEPSKASRPFDRDRDGFVLGEGAGILVLEELEHALKRGAKIYAEMIGGGMSADAHHITAPHPDGLGAYYVMSNALEDAQINHDEVDYINVHGTATPLGDIAESKAIKKVFKDHAYKLNISSSKSMIGHLLGAAGAVEAIAAILATVNNVVPPTINFTTPDPEIDNKLNFTFNKAQEREVNVSLSNTFGFGGHNSSVVFKKFSE